MDGVVTNFRLGAIKACGHKEDTFPIGIWSTRESMGLNVSEFWNYIDVTPEFWANLELLPHATELVKLCESYFDLFFLSTPCHNPESYSGKVKWMDKYFPKYRNKLILAHQKHLLAKPDCILADDSPENCENFTKYGGKGILVPSKGNELYAELDNIIEYMKICFTEVSV